MWTNNVNANTNQSGASFLSFINSTTDSVTAITSWRMGASRFVCLALWSELEIF